MDILGPFPKTKQGNPFVVVMTKCYPELTRAILTTKTNAITAACFVVELRMEDYGIPFKLLADNVPQFEPKLIVSLCSIL